ncbi:MAG: hypothetical protein ACOYMN_09855 [Roseimicrobium sp.]
METLSIKVPKEMKNRLRMVAKERKTTPSTLIKQALDDVMTREVRPGSVYDMLKDLVESGPADGIADLSTNKKHLEGLGR